jgi:hypothetical protein
VHLVGMAIANILQLRRLCLPMRVVIQRPSRIPTPPTLLQTQTAIPGQLPAKLCAVLRLPETSISHRRRRRLMMAAGSCCLPAASGSSSQPAAARCLARSLRRSAGRCLRLRCCCPCVPARS